jgi:hypothetical protein
VLKPTRPATVLAAIALAMIVACTGYTFAADPEQSAPQGEDPPGADNGAGTVPPPAEQDGVIPPPDIGDEGIHTEVPNPGAGHEEEVIPPPGTEQDAPDTVPR